jgi:hypothetical protein
MFDTARNQPMRAWACASGFSARMFAIAKGVLHEPHAELEGQLVLRGRREDRADGRRGAAVQPGDVLPAASSPASSRSTETGVVVAVVAGRPRGSR